MKKYFKNVIIVIIASAALSFPFACGYAYENHRIEETKREYLLDFIHYCQGCEGLRQINPAKDYSKSSTHDLKSIARFYEKQSNFADCTDYKDMIIINDIIKR